MSTVAEKTVATLTTKDVAPLIKKVIACCGNRVLEGDRCPTCGTIAVARIHE